MTIVAGLAVFCAIMSVLAVSKLLAAETRDLVDIGATLIVFSITAFSVLWAHVRLDFLFPLATVTVLLVGIAAGLTGIAFVSRGG